jgi:hypothetical protein
MDIIKTPIIISEVKNMADKGPEKKLLIKVKKARIIKTLFPNLCVLFQFSSEARVQGKRIPKK